MTRLFYLFIVCLFFTFLGSCQKDPPRLSRSHYKLVDSLVQKQKPILRDELDSLCDLQFSQEIDRLTDSIFQDRLNEIKRKIEADAKKD